MVTEPSLADQIAGARAYEDLHVPALFEQWCPRVLDAAGVDAGHRVLDVACGTGVLTREAAVRVGPAGHVAGVDPGRGMLAVAEALAPNIEWREAAAESLPYPDHRFDAVVSQFGLMFFSDRPGALREMRPRTSSRRPDPDRLHPGTGNSQRGGRIRCSDRDISLFPFLRSFG